MKAACKGLLFFYQIWLFVYLSDMQNVIGSKVGLIVRLIKL